MKQTWVLSALVAGAVTIFGAGTARAAAIDFGTGDAGVGGIFTLTGGGNASGTLIPIDALTVAGAPSNNGVFEVTGGCADAADSNGSGCMSFNTAANTISITGAIPSLGITSPITLLSGSFASFAATVNGLQNATGPDTKATQLLDALGLNPTTTFFNYFGFTITTDGSSPDTIISTDIRNTSVPEPGSMVLLGSGLLGLSRVARRRFRK